eukprot:gene35390-43636_t
MDPTGDNELEQPTQIAKTQTGDYSMVSSDIVSVDGNEAMLVAPNVSPDCESGHIEHYPNGDLYVGGWFDGQRDGRGDLQYADGDSYTGAFVRDHCHGHGTFSRSDGSWFTGEWEANSFTQGQGRNHNVEQGCVDEGHFESGYFHGQGVSRYENGDVFCGQFHCDYPSGEGTFTRTNGTKFSGDRIMGDSQICTTSSNRSLESVYWGTLCNGYPCGIMRGSMSGGDSDVVYKGKWTFQHSEEGLSIISRGNVLQSLQHSGDVYIGQLKANKRHGTGKMHWANGDVFEGEWVDNKRHGKGRMEWSGGDTFSGQWSDDKRHGHGHQFFKRSFLHERVSGSLGMEYIG